MEVNYNVLVYCIFVETDKTKKTIVELIPGLFSRAGAEVLFDSLCKEFSKKGFIVHVIFLYDKHYFDKSFSELLQAKGIFVHFLNKRRGIDVKNSIVLGKLLRHINPDVVHCHLACLNSLFLGGYLRKINRPIYLTVHTAANKDGNFFDQYLRKRFGAKGVIRFIGISSEISKTIEVFYKVKAFGTVYNGISLKNPTRNSKTEFTFINVARLCPEKDQDLLIKAFNVAFTHDDSLVLAIVGRGPCENELKSLAESLPCRSAVRFLGYTADVYPYLERSKAFVLSSAYEGNPISILEAMDCGLPVISTSVGGIPDVVHPGINGWLVHPNSEVELSLAMMDFLRSSKETTDNMFLSNKAAMKSFSIESCSSQYLKLFFSE